MHLPDLAAAPRDRFALLAEARARLQPPVVARPPVWPALLSAFAAAVAALGAAATIILCGPAIGAPSVDVFSGRSFDGNLHDNYQMRVEMDRMNKRKVAAVVVP